MPRKFVKSFSLDNVQIETALVNETSPDML